VSLVLGLLRGLLELASSLKVEAPGHEQERLLFVDIPRLFAGAVRELATWWWSHDNGYLGSTLRCDRCGARLGYKGNVEKKMVCPYGTLFPCRAYYVCDNPNCLVEHASGRKTRYSVAPLDQRLGIDSDHFLPCVQEVVVWLTSLDPYGKSLEFVSKLLDFSMSHRTAWLITQKVGKRVQERTEAKIAAAFSNPSNPVFPEPICDPPGIGVIEMDGTCGRIEHEAVEDESAGDEDPDAPPAPPDFREVKIGLVGHLEPPNTGRPQRRSKKARRVRARGDEPRLTNKRLAVHLGSPLVLLQQILLLAHQLGLTKARVVVVLGDGAHWIWRGVKEHLSDLGPKIVEILDYWHAVEHVWNVSNSVLGKGTADAIAWAKQREAELLAGNLPAFFDAFDKLLAKAKLLDAARPAPTPPKGKKPDTLEALIIGQIQYFRNNETRINYAWYLSQGFIIGSGAMEGCCKHHIKERIDRAGMRWGPEGVMAVLRNRTLIKNGDWLQFWQGQAERRRQAYRSFVAAVSQCL
jgi:hypothetical protein